jgi:hypothetical protein
MAKTYEKLNKQSSKTILNIVKHNYKIGKHVNIVKTRNKHRQPNVQIVQQTVKNLKIQIPQIKTTH